MVIVISMQYDKYLKVHLVKRRLYAESQGDKKTQPAQLTSILIR